MTEKFEFSVILPICHGGTLLKNALESLQQIKRLDLRARMVVKGFLQGLHSSPFHGFSVQFSDGGVGEVLVDNARDVHPPRLLAHALGRPFNAQPPGRQRGEHRTESQCLPQIQEPKTSADLVNALKKP